MLKKRSRPTLLPTVRRILSHLGRAWLTVLPILRPRRGLKVPKGSATWVRIGTNRFVLPARRRWLMEPRLVVVSGTRKGTVIGLNDGEMTIGRDASNSFCISEDAVSREHCIIKSSAGIYRI